MVSSTDVIRPCRIAAAASSADTKSKSETFIYSLSQLYGIKTPINLKGPPCGIQNRGVFLDNRERLVAGELAIHSKAFENLTVLCDQFGSRFFATPEEQASAEFLAIKFREYGLQNVKVEPYTVAGWRDGNLTELWSWQRESASLELLEPMSQQMPCISLANAPSTIEEDVTAEIFHLQKGTRAYLLEHQKELKGKLALYGNFIPPAPPGEYIPRDPENLHRSIVYGYLEEFGAAGLIFTNRNYGGGLVTGTTGWERIGEIPACGIARESY